MILLILLILLILMMRWCCWFSDFVATPLSVSYLISSKRLLCDSPYCCNGFYGSILKEWIFNENFVAKKLCKLSKVKTWIWPAMIWHWYGTRNGILSFLSFHHMTKLPAGYDPVKWHVQQKPPEPKKFYSDWYKKEQRWNFGEILSRWRNINLDIYQLVSGVPPYLYDTCHNLSQYKGEFLEKLPNSTFRCRNICDLCKLGCLFLVAV